MLLVHHRLDLDRLPARGRRGQDRRHAVAAIDAHGDLPARVRLYRQRDRRGIGDGDDRIEAFVHVVGAGQPLARLRALDAARHRVAQIEQLVDAAALHRHLRELRLGQREEPAGGEAIRVVEFAGVGPLDLEARIRDPHRAAEMPARVKTVVDGRQGQVGLEPIPRGIAELAPEGRPVFVARLGKPSLRHRRRQPELAAHLRKLVGIAAGRSLHGEQFLAAAAIDGADDLPLEIRTDRRREPLTLEFHHRAALAGDIP